MIKKIITIVLFLGLGIFFVWFSVKDLTPENIRMIKESARGVLNLRGMFFILLSICCGIVAHFIRALRNIQLIEPLGYNMRKTTAFYSVMLCYLANLAIPRLGEVMRCTLVQRYDKIPFQKTLGTVVVERAFDLIVFGLLFLIIIFMNTEMISQLVINKETGATLGTWFDAKLNLLFIYKYYLIVLTIIGIFAIVFFYKLSKKNNLTNTQKSKIQNPKSKIQNLLSKIKNILLGLWQGLISVKDLKNPYLFVLYTLLIWFFYFLGTYVCFFAFNFLQHLSPIPAFIVVVVGSIGFMIAQGGLGAYPLFVAGILMLYGIDYSQGLAAGWIGWAAQTIMILIVGFASLILASFLKIEDRNVQPSNQKI